MAIVNNGSLFGEALEAGVSLAQQTGLQFKKMPGDMAKAAGSQINPQNNSAAPGTNEANAKAANDDFIKNLYAPSSESGKLPENMLTPDGLNQAKTAEEVERQQKMAQLRQSLHNDYYQRLITVPKKPEEVERPKEKVEREKMEELQEKQKKEEKKPRAVDLAEHKAERHRGAAG